MVDEVELEEVLLRCSYGFLVRNGVVCCEAAEVLMKAIVPDIGCRFGLLGGVEEIKSPAVTGATAF